jgi:hypothetical protein
MEFNCDICKGKFSTKFTLTRHMKNKHDIKNELKKNRLNAFLVQIKHFLKRYY